MVFAKDGKVTGVVEQEDQGPPRKRVTLGDVSGHWVSQVLVRCPGLVSGCHTAVPSSLQRSSCPLEAPSISKKFCHFSSLP
jgi:hypothetical protein